MLKMDCDPDAFKCSTLIQGYMNLCLLNRGWAIYKQMTESVKKYPRTHELQPALMILRAIAKDGCVFDLSLMPRFGARNSHVALHWFDRMRNLGCIPSLFTYNTWIKCFCQEALFEYAESLFDLMEGKGIVLDQSTYLVIINECCKLGDPELAFHVIDDMDGRMLRHGLLPNAVLYTSLEFAFRFVHLMFKKQILFDHVLYISEKGCSKAYDHLELMQRDGLCPNQVT
ncbi:hypothetical protein FEM48_Zijuj02G0048400 [Ziziphus jujuba var. spinosa]|uniref:Pentatricopeptide repeat-containing protein n=1 Tax=Ziziphus jujuba var. spinosa TaxID=714518 RepID=A0A978VTQ9_ZIZJJ|nr:hypothetical protein FEM48_Zijuj02G0048400 [Ziziphus jujuba var. spinosa]